MSVIDNYQNGRTSAIPTEWNGTTYKSRFEAEVAHFLSWHFQKGKGHQTVIEYEPVSFRLSDGTNYCPDWRISTGGNRPLYVEARGYENPQSNSQLEQFVEHCRERDAGFLVFFSDRVMIADTSTFLNEYYFTGEAYFIGCPHCQMPTVIGMDWHEESPCGDIFNLQRPTLRFSDEGDFIRGQQVGFNKGYECHHCGVAGHSSLFDGHCFMVHMIQGKIHIVTLGAQLVQISSALDRRGWLTEMSRRGDG